MTTLFLLVSILLSQPTNYIAVDERKVITCFPDPLEYACPFEIDDETML